MILINCRQKWLLLFFIKVKKKKQFSIICSISYVTETYDRHDGDVYLTTLHRFSSLNRNTTNLHLDLSISKCKRIMDSSTLFRYRYRNFKLVQNDKVWRAVNLAEKFVLAVRKLSNLNYQDRISIPADQTRSSERFQLCVA